MPAVSRNQQIAAAIAEHTPSKLNPANRGLLAMTHPQLHDFAAGPRLPAPARLHPQHALHLELLKRLALPTTPGLTPRVPGA
jgi:hypothetical protein